MAIVLFCGLRSVGQPGSVAGRRLFSHLLVFMVSVFMVSVYQDPVVRPFLARRTALGVALHATSPTRRAHAWA